MQSARAKLVSLVSSSAGPWREGLSESGLQRLLLSCRSLRNSECRTFSSATGSNRGGIKALLENYKQLSKFKLSSLVVLTASAGYVAGSKDEINWMGLLWTSLGTFGAAACANTLNQVYEVANDSQMNRTRNRPLPTGRLSTPHALAFAGVMGAAGLITLYTQTDPLTTSLGFTNIALYAAVYTPLKQMSVANTWVGAVVGAIPPLMGWSAASGGSLDQPGAWVLAVALFSWQMPHFLSLAWLCREDYARGGFRMLPSIDPTGRITSRISLRHVAVLAVVGWGAVLCGITSWPFAAEASVLAAALGVRTLAFWADPSASNARAMFRGSLLYLPVLMAGIALHRTPELHVGSWAELADRAHDSLVSVTAGTQAAAPHLLPGGVAVGHVSAAKPLVTSAAVSTSVGLGWSWLPAAVTDAGDAAAVAAVSAQQWLLGVAGCPSKVYCEEDENVEREGEEVESDS